MAVKLFINSPPEAGAETPGTDAYRQRQYQLAYCYMMAQGAETEAARVWATQWAAQGDDITNYMDTKRRF